MSRIIEFPIADRPVTEGEIDKLRSEAFRNLESGICDCATMAKRSPLRWCLPKMTAPTASRFLRLLMSSKC